MTEKKTPETRGNARAGIRAALRGCVCVYLCYLAWMLIQGAGSPDTTMPVWVNWLFAVLLVLGAAGYGAYTWTQYQGEKAEERAKENLKQ